MKKTQSGHSQGGERRFSSPWPVGHWFPFDTSQDRGNGFLGKRLLYPEANRSNPTPTRFQVHR